MATTKQKAAAVALATAIAVPAEGLRRICYPDTGSILTVCYGHTGKDVVKGKTYSLAECKSLLSADMVKAIDQVDRCAPNLPENVLAAFGDTVFNMGPTVACDLNKSTAARYLHDGNLIAACNQIPHWNHSKVAGISVTLPGLTNRRAIERDICLKGLT